MAHPVPTVLRNGYSRMVLDDLIARTRAASVARKARFSKIRNRRDAEAYCAAVRERIAKCFGKLPDRGPLNVCVSGVVTEPEFRIEKLTFEGRPGCMITANLYVPARLHAPAPGVLVNGQHAQSGKADAESQNAAQELARNGFVALAFDPLAQGERDQYSKFPRTYLLRRSCTDAHNMMGKQLQLTGEFLGAWMAWDGMRALDVLASRSEVDPGRLGVTGNSGGGALSTWLWALDDRLAAAAPSCFATTLLANLENELPADAEQQPPGLIAEGLDLADFFIARAPAPAIVISQRHDFFDRRGAVVVASEAERIYTLLNAKSRFKAFLGNHIHGFFEDGRTAMRRFFCRSFGVRFRSDISVKIYPPERLFATRRGLVLTAGSRTVHDQNADLLAGLRSTRLRAARRPLRARVSEVLGLGPRDPDIIEYRNLRGYGLKPGILANRYAVRTDPGIESILFKMMPSDQPRVQALAVEKDVHLYVPHWSCEAEFLGTGVCAEALKELPVFGVDVRCMGESLSDCLDMTETRWQSHLCMEYMAQSYESMLGRSFLGRRVHDLLAVCDLLIREGAQGIRITASGQGALIASMASLFQPRIRRLAFHGAPISFEEWVQAPVLAWPYADCPKGVLRHFDLPDVYHAVRTKVIALSHWDAGTCPGPVDPHPSGRPGAAALR